MKLLEELPCGESLTINGIRDKVQTFAWRIKTWENSGLVSYCADLKSFGKSRDLRLKHMARVCHKMSCKSKQLVPFMIHL